MKLHVRTSFLGQDWSSPDSRFSFSGPVFPSLSYNTLLFLFSPLVPVLSLPPQVGWKVLEIKVHVWHCFCGDWAIWHGVEILILIKQNEVEPWDSWPGQHRTHKACFFLCDSHPHLSPWLSPTRLLQRPCGPFPPTRHLHFGETVVVFLIYSSLPFLHI